MGEYKNIKEDNQSIEIEVEDFGSLTEAKEAISMMISESKGTMEKLSLSIGNIIQNIMSELIISKKDMVSSIKNMLGSINFNVNINEIYLSIYAKSIKENKELIQLFYDTTIFPPLNYLLDKKIELSKIQMPLNQWIKSEDIKLHYLARMNKWKKKFEDENVHTLIDEIYYNFNHGNNYSVTFLTNTLLEYLLNNCELRTQPTGTNIYPRLKKILKQEIFDYIGYEGLNEKFIEKNLYCKTNEAEEFSRHIVHGDGLNMINYKTTLTTIFLYDFIQSVLKISKV